MHSKFEFQIIYFHPCFQYETDVYSIQVMFPNGNRIEVSASSMDVRIVRYNVLLVLISATSFRPHLLIILEYRVVYMMKSLTVCV